MKNVFLLQQSLLVSIVLNLNISCAMEAEQSLRSSIEYNSVDKKQFFDIATRLKMQDYIKKAKTVEDKLLIGRKAVMKQLNGYRPKELIISMLRYPFIYRNIYCKNIPECIELFKKAVRYQNEGVECLRKTDTRIALASLGECAIISAFETLLALSVIAAGIIAPKHSGTYRNLTIFATEALVGTALMCTAKLFYTCVKQTIYNIKDLYYVNSKRFRKDLKQMVQNHDYMYREESSDSSSESDSES
jgi:hypothetical protein